MPEMSKLQIRARLMSFFSEIKTKDDFSPELCEKYIGELSEIDDKECLFDIFIKEFLKLDTEKCNICAFIIRDIVPKNYMADIAFEMIRNGAYSDDIKYKLVQLMRIAELPRDLAELPQYFDNPQEILDKETQHLLETATFNPESMLDFLDFVSAVSASDRQILVNSLGNDYRGDELANIIYPILYSDFEDEFKLKIIEILGDSKSSLAIKPFNYLIETSGNENIVKACKTGLKKLKLAGCGVEKADGYFKHMIKDTVPEECYTTIPDGAGNQAFLFSRRNIFGKYLLAAVVINDLYGITDTFGFFQISKDELLKLIAKFYQSEGKYSVSPKYVKYRIDKSVNKTKEAKRVFPYEFICWSPLLSDLELSSDDINSFEINSDKEFTVDEVLSAMTEEYTFRWYISHQDEPLIEKTVEEIYDADTEDMTVINNTVRKNIPAIFDDNRTAAWQDRLKNLAYLLKNDGKDNLSEIFIFTANNEEMFEIFKFLIMQRSIMNYLVSTTGNLKESFFPVNIFKKRNGLPTKYDTKKLEKIIILLKNAWIKYE